MRLLSVEVELVASPLSISEQVYVTDLVLGPAAAITFARKAGIDLQKYEWWRVALTPQAKRALEYKARGMQIERARAERDARANGQRDKPTFDATPYRKARNALGRAK
jgi:hypothetical protein